MVIKFIYCFIRKDLSEAQRIIQLAHAAFEAGKCYGGEESPPSICLFEVSNEKELLLAAKYIKQHKIRFEMFYETDDRGHFTSIVSEPISDLEQRALFSDFTMFRSENDYSFS